MSAVEISDRAVTTMITQAVVQRSPEGIPSLPAGLAAAAPIVVSDVLGDLIFALDGHRQMYAAMGDDDAARGAERCIQHLRDYKAHVDAEVAS